MADNPKPRGRPRMSDQGRHQKASEAIQFGSRVRHYRYKAELSQAKAAKQTSGISYATWTAIESGHRNPLASYQKALSHLQAIASTLGVTLDDLIDPLK